MSILQLNVKNNNKNAFNVIFETYLVDAYRGLVYSFKLLHRSPQKKLTYPSPCAI